MSEALDIPAELTFMVPPAWCHGPIRHNIQYRGHRTISGKLYVKTYVRNKKTGSLYAKGRF
ncbi:hypothetical protein GCM10007416_34920 [Kroppenstedtia guangzhouensis]|uniref:Uncharacterized protein n=1 Tax=Kroppenstedtia guangzhouensis TaxID=1274356 RepID=A0ABQ1H5S2_9BACL|nr:hypothetical protein GCM10007416_34920 [Kroppenstedtia guangzhouensis]